ncbi:MAG: hypothetical protein KIS80_02660 [Anaerolineales bacterium]|nr:hypothetical protein [Anaerolineales bacterium]
MKGTIKFILAIVIVLIMVVLSNHVDMTVWAGKTNTPELLGEAQTIFIRFPDRIYGLTWNYYAGLLVYGYGEQRIQCYFRQAWGGDIKDFNEGFSCLMVWQNINKFRGWIDFRGHARPFCGASSGYDLPELCMWR